MSLKALQALVRRSGDEEVAVEVAGTLKKLCDASAMVKLLCNMEKTKNWTVSGLSKLKPLIPIAATVQKASMIVCKLIPFDYPETDVIVLDFSNNTRDAKIRHLANKLEGFGDDLMGSQLEATKLLREELVELAKDVKAAKKFRSQIHFKLCIARKYCADTYNQETPLDIDIN